MSQLHVIIVTHNSERVLPRCLAALFCQLRQVDSCIVVDSGSLDPERHQQICLQSGGAVRFVAVENRGFGAGNNIGFACLKEKKTARDDIVLFLNPDVFLANDVVEKICAIFAQNPRAGAIGGTLLGYDLHQQQPSGRIDSTGIFRRWYGRWYDRDQGKFEQSRQGCEQVPALCAALMACRIEALRDVIRTNGGVFDEHFFLYKEDIELSFRLRRNGWQLFYCPEIRAYHCRGWSSQRTRMPYSLRLISAKNEILLYRRHPSPYMLWAVAKYLLVRIFRV